MRFTSLTDDHTDAAELAREYKAAREIGRLRLGELRLYFRAGLRRYYIPYRDVRRCFRRVELVATKTGSDIGELEIESLVVCGEAGELAQIQLPGARAAKILMEELRERIPDAEFTKPPKPPQTTA